MSWKIILLYSFVILIMVYLMTCLGYFFLHPWFIIFPSRALSENPGDYNLEYEDLFFSTKDSLRINGWLIKGEIESKWNGHTIVLFSGNKGTMSGFLSQVKHLTGTGFNVFLFSYRGFGRSGKKWPTEQGVYRDSEAACRYLVKEKKITRDKIILLGQSLGCAMASYTAQSFIPRALILEGGFPSLAQTAARAVKWLPVKKLTTAGFYTGQYLKKIKCPVLIIHSREDKAIPLSDAEELYSAAISAKKKIIISGPHAKGLEYDSKNYIKGIEDFLNSIRL